jgi:hypothetical protein
LPLLLVQTSTQSSSTLCSSSAATIGSFSTRRCTTAAACGGTPASTFVRPVPQEVKWHRADDTQLAGLDLASGRLAGLLLNVQSGWLLARLLGGRHWLALKKVAGRW